MGAFWGAFLGSQLAHRLGLSPGAFVLAASSRISGESTYFINQRVKKDQFSQSLWALCSSGKGASNNLVV